MSAGGSFVAVLVVARDTRHDFLAIRMLTELYFGNEVLRVIATKGRRKFAKMKDLDLAVLLAPICAPFGGAHQISAKSAWVITELINWRQVQPHMDLIGCQIQREKRAG